MAGRVLIQAVPFNGTTTGATFPALPPATPGYDTGSPGGTFTGWSTTNGVMIPNTGTIILLFWCGATAAGVTQLLIPEVVGVSGQQLPAGTTTFSIAASTYGWFGPFNAATYNVTNTSLTPASALAGSFTAQAQGCVCIDFTTTTTLAVQARQIFQA